MDFLLPSQKGHLSTWAAQGSCLAVERTVRRNSVTLMLPSMARVLVNVILITKEDDRMHNYQIQFDDCFAHLAVQFKFFHLSEKGEGVLGHRARLTGPVERGVLMPVRGGEDEYKTTSLLSADCKYCIFAADGSGTVQLVLDSSSMTRDCTSRMINGWGFACRR
ncbi:late embryogenesis abundant (LEA) protein-like protein [Actinidia rufa]|uniref:Late embryogenesis abundant (LEA) protein-like protein n=1 Tax=Actinidia rufa TaxID=165716 RepID=A0A7J0EN84_9ERIC|nr:late embryogenesis abundant (LEA) protein-like protein [Actinidia rufa]